MVDLNIVFKVPEWLAAGLDAGELERVGGVIRDKVTKKVVAWLREGDSVSTEPPSEILNGQLSQLLMQNQIMMGLQVANLAVSAVGFAMIYRKLQGIERRLDNIGERIESIREQQDWQSKKDFFAQLAPVLQATKTLKDLHLISSDNVVMNKLLQAEHQFGLAQQYFQQVSQQLMDDKKEHAQAAELTMSYRAWVLAGQGRAQSFYRMGEPEAAMDAAAGLIEDHANFGKYLTEILSDPYRRFVPGNYDSADGLTVLGKQAAQTHQILRGNKLQLEFMAEHKLLASHESIPQGLDQSGLLIYLPR